MTPGTHWQMADNSTASYEFTLDQDLGVQVSSPDLGGLGLLRYYAGVFTGEGYDWHKTSDLGFTYAGDRGEFRDTHLPLISPMMGRQSIHNPRIAAPRPSTSRPNCT